MGLAFTIIIALSFGAILLDAGIDWLLKKVA